MNWNAKRPRSRRAPNRNGDAQYELPRASLLGGDALKGGQPCAPGHAGRTRLSFTERVSNALHDHARMVRQTLRALAAALLLMIAQTFMPITCGSTPALALSGTDPKTVTMSTEYRHQLNGQEAYCTVISVSPPPRGTVVSSWNSGPLMLDYVLYHSDGGFDVQYTWEPARYAVWAIMHNDRRYLTTYGSGEAMPSWFSNQVTALYQAAEDWVRAGAQGPERGCSRVYAPSSSAYQPLAICVPQLGGISLTKTSALPAISDGDACYSLAGAEYTLYADAACTTPVTILTTDENGKASASDLSQGTYYAQETKAPKGFERNSETHEVTVLPLETAAIAGGEVQDQPLFANVGLLLHKGDAEMILVGNEAQAQGDGVLAGAQFVMRRYANTLGNASGEAARSWTIQTDATGIATLDDEHLIAGDEPYRDKDGTIVLPLGTYTIEEVEAPKGYLTGNQSCTFVVEQQGSKAVTRIISGPTRSSQQPGATLHLFPNDVIRGGVKLGKVDAQRLDHAPQGSATLDGAVLAIELASAQPVMVDDVVFEPGSVVTTLTTDADGCAETACDALPYGTYVAYEVEAPEGYRLTGRDEWSRTFQIRDQGVVVDLSDAGNSVPDQVKRGDLSFVKVDGQSMRRMSDVPFVIESLTTGERHVLVTDENGQCSTSASWNAHTHLTNANDGLLDAGVSSPAAQSVEEAEPQDDGVETAGDDEELEEVAENQSADGQRSFADAAEEAVTEASETLRAAVEADAEDGSEVEANEETPLDGVSAEDGEVAESPSAQEEVPTGTEESAAPEVSASEETAAQAAPGTTLVAASADQSDQGIYDASAGIWFSGSADLPVEPDDSLGALPYDTYRVSELRCAANKGYDLVSFEIRISRDHVEVDGGTVDDHPLPAIQTALATVSSSDGGGLWQLVDTVYFNNLAVDGTEYELCGTLHYVTEDGRDGGIVTDSMGNEAMTSILFTPKAPSGSVDVAFSLDADQARGQTVVAFEELWLDGQLIASHTDPTDPDQSLSVPQIATTLTDSAGASETLGSSHVELVDAVRYSGLTVGKTYQLSGTLMDRQSGEPVLHADGTPVTAQTSLTAEEASGVATVTFVFDGTCCLGHTVVAFESLSYEGVELATHADLQDEAQSVTIPAIRTTAGNAVDGSHQLLGARDAMIVDTVSYQGLVPDETYLLEGVLVNRATGETILVDGEPVRSELAFSPEATDGAEDMAFSFDATYLLGTELTVCERLYHGETLVALHEDLSSDAQSLRIPWIGTTASTEEGEKVIDAAPGQRVIDTVFYEGLEPGASYLISGVLHIRDEQGDDAGALLDEGGAPIVASTSFVAESPSGEASVGFDIDASELGNRDLVVFELLMSADTETVIATHEDISDGGQSVSVRQPETPSTPTQPSTRSRLPQTGDMALPVQAFLVAAACALGLGVAIRLHDGGREQNGMHIRKR